MAYQRCRICFILNETNNIPKKYIQLNRRNSQYEQKNNLIQNPLKELESVKIKTKCHIKIVVDAASHIFPKVKKNNTHTYKMYPSIKKIKRKKKWHIKQLEKMPFSYQIKKF